MDATFLKILVGCFALGITGICVIDKFAGIQKKAEIISDGMVKFLLVLSLIPILADAILYVACARSDISISLSRWIMTLIYCIQMGVYTLVRLIGRYMAMRPGSRYATDTMQHLADFSVFMAGITCASCAGIWSF